uniref:Dynactin subunit 4 n=1 Tax=Timema cristinae TaxID=61476 RepID=A0A7R9H015_TIMCR|nr:unnamed protein product [Timema cristinae]
MRKTLSSIRINTAFKRNLYVESHFCANCLENIPLAEARMKKNRCATCFDCPSCTHTMSTRAVSLSTPNPDDPKKVTTHKVYYLVCGFCRWTSRDIGLPDQTVGMYHQIDQFNSRLGGYLIPTGGWPERENPNTQRINQLLEYYKVLATIERQKKDRKKFVPRRSYLHYNDKFGLTAMVARKRAGLPPLGGLAYKDDGGNAPEVLASIATEEVEQLPEDIFTKPIDISKVTTLPQRLSQPDFQPLLTQGLLPVHKQFLIKRSQRCRVCEHNVSKPEYNPSSTKFKIQLFAYYHVPEVRLVTCEPLRPGDISELIIKLSNPTQHQTTIQFASLPSPEEERAELDKELEERKKKREADRKEGEAKMTSLQDDISLVLPSLTRQLSIAEDSRPVKMNLTGDLKLPTCSVVLPPRDDAAEYDDSGDIHNFQDDIKVVVWRKANKAAVKLAVQPHNTISHDGVDVRTGFVLKYSYVNTITTLEQKTPQSVELQARVYLNIGKTVGSQ